MHLAQMSSMRPIRGDSTYAGIKSRCSAVFWLLKGHQVPFAMTYEESRVYLDMTVRAGRRRKVQRKQHLTQWQQCRYRGG